MPENARDLLKSPVTPADLARYLRNDSRAANIASVAVLRSNAGESSIELEPGVPSPRQRRLAFESVSRIRGENSDGDAHAMPVELEGIWLDRAALNSLNETSPK